MPRSVQLCFGKFVPGVLGARIAIVNVLLVEAAFTFPIDELILCIAILPDFLSCLWSLCADALVCRGGLVMFTIHATRFHFLPAEPLC